MTDQEQLLEQLLDQYEDHCDRGEKVSAEQLCRDCPELLDELSQRIKKLNALNSMIGVSEPTYQSDHQGTDTWPDWSGGSGDPLPAGRYRPIEFHARGGLGEVFVAEDVELRRNVALKRMNGEQGRIRESCRRFEVEAMITGQLEHPGIVPVYGLGRDARDRPVYAMRFIRGESLDKAIFRYHAKAAEDTDSGQSRLALQQLLRSFITVCQTVAYANSHGVVHRDIKPANVMLGNYGETLVVDWGLARKVDATQDDAEASVHQPVTDNVNVKETRMGTVKGSPAYMSPEQAAGRIDLIAPASDVYSLGATLYHVVCGKPPFRGKVHDVLDAVQQGEFVAPRQVNDSVPAALEAVCLKAMNLKPEDRYVTALELADDIDAYLADEPVSAWREPWHMRCQRWIRRHRTLVTTAAVAAGVLLASFSIATWLLSKKNRQLFLEQQATQTQRDKAESSLSAGLAAVRDIVIRFGNEGLADAPEMQAMQQEILEDAEKYLHSFVGFEDSSALQREQGLALRYKGNVQLLLGKAKEADASFRDAIEIQQGLVDREPEDAQYLVDLGTTWHELGRLHWATNATLALDAFEKSVGMIEPVLNDVPGSDVTLADVLNTYALVHEATGAIQAAIEDYQRSLALRDRVLARTDKPDVPDVQHGIAIVHSNLGDLQQTHGQIDLARGFYDKALEVWENPPDNLLLKRRYQIGLQSVYISLAMLHRSEGADAKAEEYLRKAQEVREELARLYPDVVAHQANVADSYHHLGTLFQTTGRLEQAHEEYKQAVDVYDDLVARFGENIALQNSRVESYLNLALLQHQMGLMDAAHQNFEQVRQALQTITEQSPRIRQHHLAMAAHETNYARYLRDEKGLIDDSLAMHQGAIDRLESLHAPDPTHVEVKEKLLNAHGGRANTLIALGRFEEAVNHRNRMVKLAPASSRNVHRMARALILARVDHAPAVEEAKSLAALEGLMSFDFYNFACICSLAAATAHADAQLATRDEVVRDYVRQGLAYLETARVGGAFNSPDVAQALKTDSDLDALRGEEAFEQLLQNIGAK